MFRRSHTLLLGLVLVSGFVAPSACTLPFAYVDGLGGEGGELGSGGAGSGAQGNSVGGAGGNSVASGGSGGSGGGSSAGGAGGSPAAGGSGSGTGGGSGGDSNTITIALDLEHQEMAGFGISDFWGPAFTDTDAGVLFGTGSGQIGLSILRIAMGPDGEPFNGASCYANMALAEARGVETFIATVLTPPASLKTNTSVIDGGHLDQNFHDDWAATIAAFPGKVELATGIDLYAISPQNAPDFASCGSDEPCDGNYESAVYTADEYEKLVTRVWYHLNDVESATRIMAGEPKQWQRLWSHATAPSPAPTNPPSMDPLGCSDGCSSEDGYAYASRLAIDSWAEFDLLGAQQYYSQTAAPWPSQAIERKPVWQTEAAGIVWWPEAGPSYDIDNGVAVAGWIHEALTVGEASAWLWRGYQPSSIDDNSGLVVQAGPVAKRMWTLGNYSKFVRPGFLRVNVSGAIPAGVRITAFKGPDDRVVIVAINEEPTGVALPISVLGGPAPTSVVPVVTSVVDNLVSKPAIAGNNGTFTLALAGTSVTTFVSQ